MTMQQKNKKHKEVGFSELAELYCETQECTPEILKERVTDLLKKYNGDGVFLSRCEMFGSSYFGERKVIVYGKENTFKKPPDHPFSVRGLASDTACVEAVMPKEKIND